MCVVKTFTVRVRDEKFLDRLEEYVDATGLSREQIFLEGVAALCDARLARIACAEFDAAALDQLSGIAVLPDAADLLLRT